MLGGTQERRVQDRSYGSRKKGRRKGGMKENRDEGKEDFRTGRIQDWRNT